MSGEYGREDNPKETKEQEYEEIARYVRTEFDRFYTGRQVAEETWLEAWGMYLGSPQAQGYLQSQALKTVGDVNTSWRHRISTGKTYELVETAHAYLMDASFPNKNWFDVHPRTPGDDNLLAARVLRRLVNDKLEQGMFRAAWETFLRQLLITGTSVLALPWRVETAKRKTRQKVEVPVFEDELEFEIVEQDTITQNCPDFEVLDTFDCYFDPNHSNPNQGTFIRKITKSKSEVMDLLSRGYYSGIDPMDVVEHREERDPSDTRIDYLRYFQGMTVSDWSPHEQVTLLEFWGDIHLDDECMYDHTVTVMGDHVLRCQPNPYWCGRPFIVGTFIPTPRQPYALSYLQPNLGMLHELNIISNHRLDCLELSIDPMATLRSDGLLQPEEVFNEPGKIYAVTEHDDLRYLPTPGFAASVTYTESQILEQSIDRNSGTGNYVSANSARKGERVSATEVAAVREAGGVRLTGVHKHIEETSLLPALTKIFSLIQQFMGDQSQMVRVAGGDPGTYDFYEVTPDDMAREVAFVPRGSDHVMERKEYVEQRMSFVQMVAQVPEMSQLIDHKKILTDLLNHWGFEEPEAYLKAAEPEAAPQGQDALLSQAQEMGGAGLQAGVADQLKADGGASAMNQIYNTPLPEDLAEEQNEQPIAAELPGVG